MLAPPGLGLFSSHLQDVMRKASVLLWLSGSVQRFTLRLPQCKAQFLMEHVESGLEEIKVFCDLVFDWRSKSNSSTSSNDNGSSCSNKSSNISSTTSRNCSKSGRDRIGSVVVVETLKKKLK